MAHTKRQIHFFVGELADEGWIFPSHESHLLLFLRIKLINLMSLDANIFKLWYYPSWRRASGLWRLPEPQESHNFV
jgi:hypothetical protein